MDEYSIYLRKSRADLEAERLGDMETLSRHLSMLTKLAERNHHVISHVYKEIVSGDTIQQRPEMQKLLADVNAGRWKGVYVMEVERLARGDTMDQGYVANAFRASNTFIITPTKTYNPEDPSDEEYFEFSLFMSRREYKTIKRRMQTGIQQSAREGKVVSGHVPYGYRAAKLKTEKGYTMEIHEEEATVVRQVFDWYLNGIDGKPGGTGAIAHRLIDLGVPTGQRGTTWLAKRINTMLSNPAYIGMVVYGKTKYTTKFTPDGKKKKIRQNQKEYILVEGKHQPIIDREVFDRVQEKLHGAGKSWHPVRKCFDVQNPLIGLVYCSQCGHTMGFQPTEKNRPNQILCRTHGCPTVRTYVEPLEDAIIETLSLWLENDTLYSAEPPEQKEKNDLTVQSLYRLKDERETLMKQMTRAQELVELNVYSIDEYNVRHGKLTESIRDVDSKIELIQQELSAHENYVPYDEVKSDLIRVIDTYRESETPAQKNELLKSCISRVVYTKLERRGQMTLEIYPRIK